MAYDEQLAERIRTALRGRDDVEERKMFGGIAFMVAGRMACGVIHDDLWSRSAPMATTKHSQSRTRDRWTSRADRCAGWSMSTQPGRQTTPTSPDGSIAPFR
jgi:hypothetical protein